MSFKWEQWDRMVKYSYAVNPDLVFIVYKYDGDDYWTVEGEKKIAEGITKTMVYYFPTIDMAKNYVENYCKGKDIVHM